LLSGRFHARCCIRFSHGLALPVPCSAVLSQLGPQPHRRSEDSHPSAGSASGGVNRHGNWASVNRANSEIRQPLPSSVQGVTLARHGQGARQASPNPGENVVAGAAPNEVLGAVGRWIDTAHSGAWIGWIAA